MPALTSNTLAKQVDLPTWEWTRFAPAISSALSSSCTADNGNFMPEEHGRYIYYLISATQFFRYDTWTDMYQQLSTPPLAPVTFSSMKYNAALGIDGSVIAASASTLTIPSISMQSLKGYDVVIVSGTGSGQRRTITGVAEPITHDSGIVTAVNNVLGALNITDTTKSWLVNQYAGYTLRITGNAGVSQIRRILSNTATVLTLGDTIQMNETWNNPAIFSPAINATAGSQATYAIESQVITLDSAWDVTPDATSVFKVQSGLVILVSNNTSTPFFTMQVYDIISDTWYILPSMQGIFAAAGNDIAIERTTENSSIWERGIASSASTITTLVDASLGVDRAAWTTDQWKDYWVYIYSGTGAGQIRRIASNTSNTLTWVTSGTAPTATSRYFIIGFDAGTATSGASTTITDSTKAWDVNRWRNYSVRIMAGTGAGQIRPIASNTATAITVVGTWVTAPDSTSVYTIQGDPEKIYLQLGGITGFPIHNIDSQVPTFGRQQDFGIARNASATVAGQEPIAISTLANAGTTATVTTAHTHQFRIGQLVTVRGATDANFNVTNVAIATVPLATTFTYVMAGTPASTTIVSSQSTTLLVDATKSWTTNQWAGQTVYMYTGAVTATNGSTTGQSFRIASNTATTLTLVAVGTAPTNGVSRYSISTSTAIGANDFGVATGTQGTTSLQDTTKVGTFTTNNTSGSTTINVTAVTSGQLFVGHAISGTGIPTGSIIVAFGTGTGGIGTYIISAACTSTNTGLTMTSGWVVNGYAGKRLRILTTTGTVTEVAITSNTNNTLTIPTITAPTTLVTGYVILEQAQKNQGVSINWAFGTSDLVTRGRYMFVVRGGGAIGFDRFDLTTDRCNQMFTSPLTETLSTGTMTAYDGADNIFYHKDATQRVMSLNVVTSKINGGSMYPYVAPTAVLGNRMEIFTTKDRLKYLWLNRASFQECFRCLIFWT
jgi:hypothetical protein